MEINEKLFVDVLDGKIKGTFVLKNGFTVKSNRLFSVGKCVYGLKGFSCHFLGNGLSDSKGYNIIDFKVDKNMSTKLEIEIPEEKEIDWDESKKQNKIVLKDKRQLTYEEICDKLDGMIDIPLFDTPSEEGNALVASEHYLECILAKNKLATVTKYLNNGWKLEKNKVYCGLAINGEREIIFQTYVFYDKLCHLPQFAFKTEELAQQAIEILGEETVKLALEPLGI